MKVAIVISHPIQHFCPQYVSLSKIEGIDLKVFFASRIGQEKYIDPQFKKEISWGNLRLDQFNHKFLNNEIIQPDKDLDAASLNSELSAFEPDLVIVYGYYQKLQRRAYRWAVKNSVKIAYISDSERRQKRSWLKEIIKYPFLRNYFRKVDYFLTVGNANEEYYRYHGVGQDKLVRMHFSIDLDHYRDCFDVREQLRERIRGQYGIGKDDLVLSVVGKLVSWKNQDHIIDAMRQLEGKGFITTLFMIGSGDETEAWKKKAGLLQKSKVIFTGFVNIEDLPAFYAATDIYVHPASVEPHSIAVSEAIYMGCPVVISDRCGSYGVSDDVQEGVNGSVYNFGDIAQLAEKIAELAKDPVKRDKMVKASHEIGVRFQSRSHGLFLEDLLERWKK